MQAPVVQCGYGVAVPSLQSSQGACHRPFADLRREGRNVHVQIEQSCRVGDPHEIQKLRGQILVGGGNKTQPLAGPALDFGH